MSDLFELIDTIIITGIIVVIVIAVGFVAYAIIKAETERKEYERTLKLKEEKRQRRLKKVPVENRKCSCCKYGKEKVLSDMVIFICSHPKNGSSEISVIESENIGCSDFDPELGSFLD